MVLTAQVLYTFAFIICADINWCCAFIYPGNSAYGIFAAIAVPLNIPHRNVFVSYNFEANYNLPGDAKTIIPGPYQRFTSEEDTNADETVVNTAEAETEVMDEVGRKESNSLRNYSSNNRSRSETNPSNSNALITRRAIYQIFQDKLKVSGLNGKACLLKLICEVNASLVGRNNGVFGSIVHILLTPSTSSYESVSPKMYKAEENGVMSDCFQYENKCPHNILDQFSVPIEDFLYNLLPTS